MYSADKTPAALSPAAVARIEESVDRFEEGWQAGQGPAIEDHLPADSEVRAALLVELVHVELEYRLKNGEAVRVEAYLERFPELKADRDAVLDLLAAEWKLRRRSDPSVDVDEYIRRFPDCRDDLMASATVSVLPSGALGAAAPDSEPSAAASTRSRYRGLRLHARGGLGEILTAQDEDLHREVALKRLQPRLAGAAESRGRFLREAEITSQLEHPGVVPVYGLGQAADGSPVYAMRFIRGETFQQAVERFHTANQTGRAVEERRLAFRRLASRFVSVCNTVAYAHNRGFLHRDLKPGNILIGEYGETLVVDWGLAKPIAGPESDRIMNGDTATASSDWTQAGEVIGTPAYMSPEQADGRWNVVGPASDVYSLGATLYVLLTGRPPFGPGLVGEVLEKVRRGAFVRPRHVKKDVCPNLEAVCLKAMAARREQRYPTALALAADLERWLAGEAVGARREPILTRVRRWTGRHATLTATAGVVLAAAAVVAVVTALWFAAVDRERSAKAVAEARQKELDRADRERYLFHVAAAAQDWWAADFDLAAQHLAECTRPELHGWEWNYLTRSLRDKDAQLLLTLRGHGKEVWNVAFSPDGKRLASASLDGTVRVWDAADGRLLFTLEGHQWRAWHVAFSPEDGRAWAAAFSPDGSLLATGGGDRTVQLWDANTGRWLRTFGNVAGEVHAVAFSRDGKLLAAAAADWPNPGGELRLWDVPAWTERDSIRISGAGLTSVAFSPDGGTVAAGATNGLVDRWDVATMKKLGDFKEQQEGPVRAVAFSPDGQWIASASNDCSVGVWDAQTGEKKLIAVGHGRPAWGVAFSPDGRRLASSGDDAAIHIWDVASGRRIYTLSGHTQGIANVVFSPDGTRLASASDDQTVRIWDARCLSGTARVLTEHKNPVWGVAWSQDGKRLASAGGDGPNADAAEVRVWTAEGRGLAALHVPDGARGVAFGAGGRLLAAAGGDGTVRVWDVDAGWTEHILNGHAKKVLAVAFSPDGRLIASASADQTVKLWDVATWTEVRTLRGHADVVHSVVFSPDGSRLASGGDDKLVKVWNTATGAEERTLAGCPAAVCAVVFSPDGKRVAAGAAASKKVLTTDLGEIVVWDRETGQTILTMRGHVGDVRALAFSPDGHRLVSAGSDKAIILWEPTTGQQILPLYLAQLDCINSVAFSPDGGRLASASCDGTIVIWDGTPPEAGPLQ
ncbi:MAG TPA: protein kinase [Gemmataceae bacterium]|nr:protein kinase [Gemmataceae bacterium]